MCNGNIRRAIVLPFFIILSFVTKAQLSVGIKGGPDFARLLDAEEVYTGSGSAEGLNAKSRTLFYGGVFVDIPVSSNHMFYLRPQLEYAGAGGQTPLLVDYSGNALSLSTKYSLHYIDLPVQFLFSPTLGLIKPWIGAGFYGGVLLSGTAKAGTNSPNHLLIGSQSNDDVERYDFGYAFTAGLSLKWGFLVGADFQQGLKRIAPPSGSGGPTPNTRNSVLGVHIGYQWTIK